MGLARSTFSWYAGVNQFGDSLYTAALQAAVGVRVTGAVAAVVAAVGFAYLLSLAAARRPVLGAVLGAAIGPARPLRRRCGEPAGQGGQARRG